MPHPDDVFKGLGYRVSKSRLRRCKCHGCEIYLSLNGTYVASSFVRCCVCHMDLTLSLCAESPAFAIPFSSSEL